MIELILGGARSGKSALAEERAKASGLQVIYLATAEAKDAEMSARIHHHRLQRPSHWITVEEPVHLANKLQEHCSRHHCIVVDCLTLWLGNLLVAKETRQTAESVQLTEEIQLLLHTLKKTDGHIIIVSNEVGMGIVPMGELTRLFMDEHGRLNQQLGQIADKVTLVVAGLPLQLK